MEPVLIGYFPKRRTPNPPGWMIPEQVEEIAKIKMVDLNSFELEKVMEQVKGTARSMGVEVAV